MDMKTISSFQQTCWYLHDAVKEGKPEITSAKIEEWRRELKILIGMGIAKPLMRMTSITLFNPIKSYEKIQFFQNSVMYVFPGCCLGLGQFFKEHPQYKPFVNFRSRCEASGMESYTMDFNEKIEEMSIFLYEIYIYFVAKIWQNKDLERVKRYHYSEIVRMLSLDDFEYMILNRFNASMYLNIEINFSEEKDYFQEYMEIKRKELLQEFDKYFYNLDVALMTIKKK
jgi:hypothetical protein